LNEPFKSEKNAKVTTDIVSFSIPFIRSTTWYANVQSLKISDDQIIEVLNKKIGSMYRNHKCDDSKGLERRISGTRLKRFHSRYNYSRNKMITAISTLFVPAQQSNFIILLSGQQINLRKYTSIVTELFSGDLIAKHWGFLANCVEEDHSDSENKSVFFSRNHKCLKSTCIDAMSALKDWRASVGEANYHNSKPRTLDHVTAPQYPLLVTRHNKDSARFWLNLTDAQLDDAIEKSRAFSQQRQNIEEEADADEMIADPS